MNATVINIIVPAVPVAQPRQRQRMVGEGTKAFIQNYTPTKHPVNAFKATVRMIFAIAYSGPPLTGPLRLDVVFVLPRVAAQIWKRKPMPRIWHAKKKNDRDNLDKAVMDALSGLAYEDDGQVAAGETTKVIAAGHEQPHVEITLCQLSDGDCPQPPPETQRI